MVTLVYAGVLVLIGLYLAYRSSMKRLSTEIMIGTGDNTEMLQASRVHGNFVEYVPFFLILSGALELSGQLPTLALYILGDIFVLARIAHAYGLTKTHETSPPRLYGTLFTWLVLAVQSLWALWIGFGYLMQTCFGFCT